MFIATTSGKIRRAPYGATWNRVGLGRLRGWVGRNRHAAPPELGGRLRGRGYKHGAPDGAWGSLQKPEAERLLRIQRFLRENFLGVCLWAEDVDKMMLVE